MLAFGPLYPALMEGKRGPSEEPGVGGPPAGSAPGAAGADASPGPERFGPLAVTRLRKDDGRALLVFRRPDDTERYPMPGQR